MEERYDTGKFGTFFVDSERNTKIAQLFKRYKHPQADELEIFRKYVDSNSIFLDIGANIGTISIPVAMITKKVHSFEPIKENRDLLEKNIETNNLSNVEIHTVALGSTTGNVSLSLPSPEYDAGSFTVTGEGDIPMVTLDSLSLSPTFMKIDVEGYEYQVLIGAAETVQKHHPVLFFEMNLLETRKQGDWWLKRVSNLIHSYGYDIYLSTETGNKKVRSIAWTIFKQAPKAFVKGDMNYCVNFLAIPSPIPFARN